MKFPFYLELSLNGCSSFCTKSEVILMAVSSSTVMIKNENLLQLTGPPWIVQQSPAAMYCTVQTEKWREGSGGTELTVFDRKIVAYKRRDDIPVSIWETTGPAGLMAGWPALWRQHPLPPISSSTKQPLNTEKAVSEDKYYLLFLNVELARQGFFTLCDRMFLTLKIQIKSKAKLRYFVFFEF